MAGKSSKSEWSAKKPYFTKITDNFVLNGESSRKETRHIVFDLGDSGLEYKAGDALGVVPRCPPEEVEEILRICGFSGEEIVETNLGDCPLRDALTDRYEIHRVSKKWIKGLAERSGGDAPKSEIRIVSRKRSSSVDGSLIVDWSSSGEGDVP